MREGGGGALSSFIPSQSSSVSLVFNNFIFYSLRVITERSHSHGFLSEDVEDESIREEVILSPVPSMLKLQIVSKPIDLSVAKVGVNLKV